MVRVRLRVGVRVRVRARLGYRVRLALGLGYSPALSWGIVQLALRPPPPGATTAGTSSEAKSLSGETNWQTSEVELCASAKSLPLSQSTAPPVAGP